MAGGKSSSVPDSICCRRQCEYNRAEHEAAANDYGISLPSNVCWNCYSENLTAEDLGLF